MSSVGTFWQGPSSLEVPLDEVHRVFEETFFPYVGLTQALIPALGPDTHFIKLNGILSLQAVPHVSAFGVSATAQMAWTRSLIAEATESTPWITELVIDSLVRTRSLQTLPKEYISGDDIAQRDTPHCYRNKRAPDCHDWKRPWRRRSRICAAAGPSVRKQPEAVIRKLSSEGLAVAFQERAAGHLNWMSSTASTIPWS